MARPKAADYDDRKQMILDQAAHIFAREGYHKSSVSMIGKECGIAKSLVYHYFPSKQDILYHAMREHVALLRREALAVIKVKHDARDSLTTLIRVYIDIYGHSASKHILLLNALRELPKEQRKEIVDIQSDVVHVFADLFEELSPGSLEKHKVKSAVSMLLLGMINWTYTWYNQKGEMSEEHLSNIITSMFLSALHGLDDHTLTPDA